MYERIEWQLIDELGVDATIVGIDEATYSPHLALDCVVAAVFMPLPRAVRKALRDSKFCTPQQLLEQYAWVVENSVFAVVPAHPRMIALLGVTQARDLATRAAIRLVADELLMRYGKPLGSVDLIIADLGYRSLKTCSIRHYLEAGQHSTIVAAAGTLAKITSVALAGGYAALWPGYGLEHNAGCASKEHVAMLREAGPTPVHRHGGRYAREWWRRILAQKRP